MELTDSWSRARGADPATVPLARLAVLTERYELRETRNAGAGLAATAPEEFAELCAVLDAFVLHTDATHPHVHMVVRSLGDRGERLAPKKADLEHWRQVFAQALDLS